MKRRLLREEASLGTKNLHKRRSWNARKRAFLAGGECDNVEPVWQFVAARLGTDATVQPLDTIGGLCTARVQWRGRTYYAKQLTREQHDYYITNDDAIRPVHAPYELHRHAGLYFQLMPAWGQMVRKSDDMEPVRWAIRQLRLLHAQGVFHGDIIADTMRINYTNILEHRGEYRLIDFGPPSVEPPATVNLDAELETEKVRVAAYESSAVPRQPTKRPRPSPGLVVPGKTRRRIMF